MAQPTDLLLIGSTLLLALAAHAVGQRIHVPRVTLLLLLGALSGPELLDLLPDGADDQFEFVTQLTLAMVGFLLGERMVIKHLAEGREALIVSLMVTLVTAVVVAGAILFSLCLVSAELVMGNNATGLATLGVGIVEVGGALLLGVVLGLPMAWLTGRLRPGEPMLLESAGFVFVAAGVAGLFGFSYLLTCMTLGVVVANRARHHVRPFRSIEGISEPFLAIFFFMAGYQLDWAMLPSLGALGLVYVAARVGGRRQAGRWSVRRLPGRLHTPYPATHRCLPDAPGRPGDGPGIDGRRTPAGTRLHSAADHRHDRHLRAGGATIDTAPAATCR